MALLCLVGSINSTRHMLTPFRHSSAPQGDVQGKEIPELDATLQGDNIDITLPLTGEMFCMN